MRPSIGRTDRVPHIGHLSEEEWTPRSSHLLRVGMAGSKMGTMIDAGEVHRRREVTRAASP